MYKYMVLVQLYMSELKTWTYSVSVTFCSAKVASQAGHRVPVPRDRSNEVF